MKKKNKKKKVEYTGGPTTYYTVRVTHPNQVTEPYDAECLDIINALGMDFNEGEAFKAIWRRCAARKLGIKKKGHSDLYDCEKAAFYTNLMLEIARRE